MSKRLPSLVIGLAMALTAVLFADSAPTQPTRATASAFSEASPDEEPTPRGPDRDRPTRPAEQANDRAFEATGPTGSDGCVHPYPCGDEWPEGLEGPFELAEVRHVFVEMSDGVQIEGWIGMPALPDGVEAPVIMSSSPYHYGCGFAPLWFGPYCAGGPGDEGFWDDPPHSGPVDLDEATANLGVAPIGLVQRGYTVAFFAVRGTANSGGCFSLPSGRDQLDQAELVQWLADQPWSNRRVAAAGLSNPSLTATEAAVEAPGALKTVVVTGVVPDLFTFFATPQGAVDILVAHAISTGEAEISLYPDPFHPERLPGRVVPETQRLCQEFIDGTALISTLNLREDRDADFWAERRLTDRFDDVTASVLLLHGLQDILGHGWQEDYFWQHLTQAPKRQVEGQWGHAWPTESDFRAYDPPRAAPDPAPFWGYDFEELLYDWYAYWLKGIGPVPEGLGSVDFQDDSGEWRRTASWPPVEVENEALYLSRESLAGAGEPGSRSYSTRPYPGDYFRYDPVEFATDTSHAEVGLWATLCPDHPLGAAGPVGVAYSTEVVEEPVVLAGNPHAWLNIVSDEPGGIVDVRLVDIGPDFGCNEQGRPFGYQQLGHGAADLRFHAGNFVGVDFPVGEPTPVRIDPYNLAHRLEPGHRLVLVVSTGEGFSKYGTNGAYYPTIEVIAGPEVDASHIVLPIVEGTLGGAPDPDVAPPRPFSPGWSP